MRLEMYMRDDEFSEAFEYLFSLFYEDLVPIQSAQTHMFLSKTEGLVKKIEPSYDKWAEQKGTGTDLDTPPPIEVGAHRAVLNVDAPAERDEPPHLQ